MLIPLNKHNVFYSCYPFAAIVGQDMMKKALLLNAVDPKIGGVLIQGEKGTAKSTAVRALADILPEIKVVADCSFSCDPHDYKKMCSLCKERTAKGEVLPVSQRKMRVVTLPMNATEDRVVGTMDMGKVLREGRISMQPGMLAVANRGILYIDEVNLLDDHIADLLLDAAAMGMNIIEREGMSLSHPAGFILVGTMNPEEGELRPQIIDRFGLSITIGSESDVALRKKIIDFREEFEDDTDAFRKQFATEHQALTQKIVAAREKRTTVRLDDNLKTAIIQACLEAKVDGHRADLTACRTAICLAALAGRENAGEKDVTEALGMVLNHRRNMQPFEHSQLPQNPRQHSPQNGKQPNDSQFPEAGEFEKKKEPSPSHSQRTYVHDW